MVFVKGQVCDFFFTITQTSYWNFLSSDMLNCKQKFAVLFLAISTFFEFLCVLLYAFFFPKLPIVKYFRTKAASEGSKTVQADLAAAGIQTKQDQQVVLEPSSK